MSKIKDALIEKSETGGGIFADVESHRKFMKGKKKLKPRGRNKPKFDNLIEKK